MSSNSLNPIDLSEFDPYSPNAIAAVDDDPLFPLASSTLTAEPAGSPSGTSRQIVQPPPPITAVPVLGLANGEQDPLATRLGRIQLGTSSSTASSRTPSPAPPTTVAAVNAAQQLRNNRILTDLAREPFTASTTTAPLTDGPNSFDPVSPTSMTVAPSRRRPSRSGSNNAGPNGNGTTTSFSPPRRLSSLMDFHAASASHTFSPSSSSSNEHAGVSSPPVESSVMADPFHPSAPSRPHEATRRIRQLSFSSSPPSSSWSHHGPPAWQQHSTSPTSGQPDSSAEWGEFQDADVVDLAGSLAATTTTSSPPPSSPGPSISPSSRTRPTHTVVESRSRTLPAMPSLPSLPSSLPFSGSSLPAVLGRAESLLPKSTSNGFVASLFNSLGGGGGTVSGPESHDAPIREIDEPPLLPPSESRPGRRQRQQQPPLQQSRATTAPSTAPSAAAAAAADVTATRRTSSPFDPNAQPIRLVGLRPGVVRVLEEDVAEGIRPSLPPRLRLSHKWTLLYSLDQHGISIHTLFANLQRGLRDRDGGFVLVIKSEKGEVFGGYCSEALRDAASSANGGGGSMRNGTGQRWTGDGSCFLWKSIPFSPTDFRIGSSIRTFKPTFRNTYYQHASSEFLAFGGGEDGVFGLWIDGVFEKGFTGRCETFANEPLVDLRKRGIVEEEEEGQVAIKRGGGGAKKAAAEEGKFEIVGFECWAVG